MIGKSARTPASTAASGSLEAAVGGRAKPEAGFTLIELLVVVLIVGILAAIAIPQYLKSIENGRFSEALSCLGGIATAENNYFTAQGKYTNDNIIAPTALSASCAGNKYFTTGAVTGAGTSGYVATLTRNTVDAGGVPAANYTVLYTVTVPGSPGAYSSPNGVVNGWAPN